jgi:hypothetical protein
MKCAGFLDVMLHNLVNVTDVWEEYPVSIFSAIKLARQEECSLACSVRHHMQEDDTLFSFV